MEPEAAINLFDSVWFYLEILEKQSTTSTSSTPEPNPGRQIQENPSKPNVSSQLSIHTRSKSDQLLSFTTDISSPDSALLKPHLQTVLSDREISLEIPKTPHFKKPGKGHDNKKKKRFSKSLSELEFEEVKGFMDLGFVFSEEDKDSSLVEIIPGLQRLGQKTDCDDQGKEEERSVQESSGQRVRPYLSEAWEVSKYRQKEEINPLMKWRVPPVGNEIDMKDSLKWWAHTVASAVR